TDDAVNLYRLKGGIPLGTFYDVRPHLKRMEIGAILAGQEIIQIGQLLKGIREIFDFFQGVKEEEIALNHLYSLSDEMIVLSKIERRIFSTLTEGGGVVDDASSKLKSIRTSIRQTESGIREKLNNIISGCHDK